MDLFDDSGELVASTTFTQVCYECEPPRTVQFVDGQQVPGECGHDLPAIVIGCGS